MQIIKDELYLQALQNILEYIAKDSYTRANNFLNALDKHLNTLTHFSYKFRQSLHYNDKQIRDCIFKGYTIPYLIDEEKKLIVILDIFKWIDKKII